MITGLMAGSVDQGPSMVSHREDPPPSCRLLLFLVYSPGGQRGSELSEALLEKPWSHF